MAPGARNTFAAPIFEPEVFQKQMYCFEKSAYDTVVTFWPPQWLGARGIVPPCSPSLRLSGYAIKTGKFSEKFIFKSERHELLFHEHLQCSSTIRHRSCTNCQQNLLVAFQVSSCSFCVTSNPAPRVFSAWTCVCFANMKIFPTFNELLF